jgi:hypothetical protein
VHSFVQATWEIRETDSALLEVSASVPVDIQMHQHHRWLVRRPELAWKIDSLSQGVALVFLIRHCMRYQSFQRSRRQEPLASDLDVDDPAGHLCGTFGVAFDPVVAFGVAASHTAAGASSSVPVAVAAVGKSGVHVVAAVGKSRDGSHRSHPGKVGISLQEPFLLVRCNGLAC